MATEVVQQRVETRQGPAPETREVGESLWQTVLRYLKVQGALALVTLGLLAGPLLALLFVAAVVSLFGLLFGGF